MTKILSEQQFKDMKAEKKRKIITGIIKKSIELILFSFDLFKENFMWILKSYDLKIILLLQDFCICNIFTKHLFVFILNLLEFPTLNLVAESRL